MDMLNGTIWTKVLRFSIPLAITSILQQLFNSADIAVLGRFAGKHAMAAVGSTSSTVALLVNFFVGISIGANVVISNFTGQNNEKKINEATHTSIILSLVCGVLVLGIGQVIAQPMMTLLGTPAEIAPMAVKYLRIYFAGMPFILLYNFESAIFRSQGNTKVPLLCLVISGILNVVLNIIFVLGFHMDVDGVATATVIANIVSSSLMFIFLTREKGAVQIHRDRFHANKTILVNILRIGVPSGIQGMVFSLSNLVIQSAINSLGSDVVAGSAAAFNLEIFGYYILNSFGQAAVTFVGQNYGAGNFRRCRKITKQVLIMDELVTIVVAALLIYFGKSLLMIFNEDPQVIEFGYVRVYTLLSAEVINVVIEVLSGSMRGYGASMVPAMVTFIGICGTRILWVYTIFAHSHSWATLMAVYPVSWLVTMIVMIFAYFHQMRKIHAQEIKAA
jgi:putative MATE family efflux protein